MTMTLMHIRRWPVKGLNAEELDCVTLETGARLPGDRRFALAHGSSAIDPTAPKWMPKNGFHMLMKDPRLAALDTDFDEAEGVLTIRRNGRQVTRGRITEDIGRRLIEEFFAAYLGESARGMPHLVQAPAGEAFADCQEPFISVINLASVRDLERVVKGPVDPLRFRANLYVDGVPAWAERAWAGNDIAVGSARLKVIDDIGRCAATNVDPSTGVRDMNIPRTLMAGFRHADMGVYTTVTAGGIVAVGDPVKPPE
jgi:uncharacterized protein YcbX